MNDEEFREAYKPLQVPAHFDNTAPLDQNILFALAQLNDGTVTDVTIALEKLNFSFAGKDMTGKVKEVLTDLFDRGLLTGHDAHGSMHYNFHKITRANDGAVDPDLLAPGLD